MNVGDLVVVPTEPGLGVGRVERLLDVDGRPGARMFLYESGDFVVRALDVVTACPPGVWPPVTPEKE